MMTPVLAKVGRLKQSADGQQRLKKPIFLVGAERSGTTLLRLMLDHHPQLAFLYEFEYAVQQLDDEGNMPATRTFLPWLKRQRIFRDTGFAIDESLDFAALMDSFLRQKQALGGKQQIGATVHHHFDRLPFLWPDARYIHLIRDGRDVARSNVTMGWAGNVWAGANRWLAAARQWDTLRAKISASHFIEVRYETLAAEPKQTLAAICDFLGLPYSDGMFSYAQSTTYDLPDPRFTYQWRQKMGKKDIGLAECRMAAVLQARGYPLSGHPIPTPSPAEIRILERADRWGQRKFRLKRYGWRLLLLENVARRLPIQAWHDRLMLKIQAIDNQHIK